MRDGKNAVRLRKSSVHRLEVLLYAASVLLWFKGNFPGLRALRFSPLIPTAGLAVLLAARGIEALRRGGLKVRFRIPKAWAAPLLIVLLATVVRVPFLLHADGLIDSDEAISLLQAKHIAEGKVPPVYYYGASYQGTLSQHVTALGFLLFGYSPLLAKIIAHLFFVAFLAIQYALLKKTFSARFAFQAGLVLALPLYYLIQASLEVASAFALVFLLSSLILYLTVRISEDGREELAAPLGFVMGLAFWTHPMSAISIVAAAIVLARRFRLRLKPYAVLGSCFFLGAIPVLYADAFGGFHLVPFVAGGAGSWMVSGEKVLRLGRLLQTMLTSRAGPAGVAMLIWLVLGAVVLSLRSWKQRERKSADIFAIFVFVYSVFFVLSGWSVTDVVRYLYLLMIAVPVLLLAPLRLVRTRILSGLAALVLMGALIGANIGSVGEYYGSTVRAEQIYEKTISAMEATGVEYWMAEYWRAYALTAVSGERLIVRSFTMNRYLPYSLAYDNAGQGDNYVFMGEKNSPNDILSRNLEALLMRLDIPFRKTSMGDVSLFYRIESDVFPPVLKEKPPENIPRFEIADLSFEKGRLRLAFRLSKPIAADRFRLVLEIPGYNRKKIWLSKGQEWMSTMLSYPPGGPFTLLTSVEYGGLRIDTTVREMEISPPATPDPQPPGTVFFLRGISPEFDYGDRRLRYCEPDAAFRVAPPFSGAETRLRIYLDSPFEFSRSPGCADYRQTVVFRSKGRRFLQRNLLDGMNVIDLVLPPSSGSDPEEIEMNFSWQAWFEFAPFRRLSAVLEKVEFIEPGTGDH